MSTGVGTPDLLLDLEVAVRRDHAVEHRRAVHSLNGRSVHLLETLGRQMRTRTIDVRAWRSELAAVCKVVAPMGGEPSPSDGVLLPWDLVVGSGAAIAAGRADLYSELVGREDASLREEVGRLHRSTRGRLRAVATMPERHQVAWVAWVLLTDGWRALTPCTADPPGGQDGVRAMVRLDRRDPADLSHDVARWAARATR
jgi:hypothetical protein